MAGGKKNSEQVLRILRTMLRIGGRNFDGLWQLTSVG